MRRTDFCNTFGRQTGRRSHLLAVAGTLSGRFYVCSGWTAHSHVSLRSSHGMSPRCVWHQEWRQQLPPPECNNESPLVKMNILIFPLNFCSRYPPKVFSLPLLVWGTFFLKYLENFYSLSFECCDCSRNTCLFTPLPSFQQPLLYSIESDFFF